ncbi:MAG: hypothetical protein JXQ90_08180 [Cyclobacteriaceae bacterium]
MIRHIIPLVLSALMFSQTTYAQKSTPKDKKLVGVKATLMDGSVVRGHLMNYQDGTLQLFDRTQPTGMEVIQLPYHEIDSIRYLSGQNFLTPALKVGFPIGLVGTTAFAIAGPSAGSLILIGFPTALGSTGAAFLAGWKAQQKFLNKTVHIDGQLEMLALDEQRLIKNSIGAPQTIRLTERGAQRLGWLDGKFITHKMYLFAVAGSSRNMLKRNLDTSWDDGEPHPAISFFQTAGFGVRLKQNHEIGMMMTFDITGNTYSGYTPEIFGYDLASNSIAQLMWKPSYFYKVRHFYKDQVNGFSLSVGGGPVVSRIRVEKTFSHFSDIGEVDASERFTEWKGGMFLMGRIHMYLAPYASIAITTGFDIIPSHLTIPGYQYPEYNVALNDISYSPSSFSIGFGGAFHF